MRASRFEMKDFNTDTTDTINWTSSVFFSKNSSTKGPDHLGIFRDQETRIKGLFHQTAHTWIPRNTAGKKLFLAWLQAPAEHARDLRIEFIAKLFFFHRLSLRGGSELIKAQTQGRIRTDQGKPTQKRPCHRHGPFPAPFPSCNPCRHHGPSLCPCQYRDPCQF